MKKRDANCTFLSASFSFMFSINHVHLHPLGILLLRKVTKTREAVVVLVVAVAGVVKSFVEMKNMQMQLFRGEPTRRRHLETNTREFT